MPRRSRSSSPSRTQTRQASTSARPAASPPAVPTSQVPTAHSQAPRQSGLFGQMAATAGGVAVGSTMGHMMSNALGGIFGSGDSGHAEPAQTNAQPPQQSYNQSYENTNSAPCSAEFQAFTKCMESSSSDISQCQVYLDVLKQCKAFSSEHI